MRLFRAIIAFLIGVAYISGPLPAHPAQSWNQENMAAEELYERFGSAQDQISPAQALKILHRLINEERKKNGLQSLSWDYTAANAAHEHADEMAKFRYLSHMNLLGEKPNERYNRLGGTNQVSENVSYRESSLRLYLTPQIVEDIHQRWMGSAPHRRNILTRTHNAVGLAITLRWDGTRSVLTAAEEFVGDYGVVSKLPLNAGQGDELRINCELANRDVKFQYIAVGWEAQPDHQTPSKLNSSLNGYSLPKPFVVLMSTSDENVRYLKGCPNLYSVTYQPTRGQVVAHFSIEDVYRKLKEKTGSGKPKPGLYYITLWVSTADAAPFIASTQVVSVSG
jgi:uncharacterized protein YkwD